MVRETEVNLYQIDAIQDGIDGAIDHYDQLLDQMEVYNRLTNNSKNEGLFVEDRHVYINASMIHAGYMSANYIRGGVLDLGGLNNAAGQLRIRDADGAVIGLWNNGGLEVAGGSITGGTLETAVYTDEFDNVYYYAINRDGLLCYLNGTQVSRIRRNATDLELQSLSITLDGAVAVLGTLSAGQGISIPAAYGLETDSISSYSGSTVYFDVGIDAAGEIRTENCVEVEATNGKAELNDGSMELFHATPYIDFHFGKSTADFTSRIIEAASGVLDLKTPNGFRVNGKDFSTLCNVKQYDLAVSSVSCAAGAGTVVLNWEDMTSVIGSGRTLVGAAFLWADGGALLSSNCTAGSGTNVNKLYLRLYNPTSAAQAVTTVRLLLFYR